MIIRPSVSSRDEAELYLQKARCGLVQTWFAVGQESEIAAHNQATEYFVRAEQLLEEALSQDPSDQDAVIALAKLYQETGRTEEAHRCARRILKPDFLRLFFYELADFCLKCGDRADALKFAESRIGGEKKSREKCAAFLDSKTNAERHAAFENLGGRDVVLLLGRALRRQQEHVVTWYATLLAEIPMELEVIFSLADYLRKTDDGIHEACELYDQILRCDDKKTQQKVYEAYGILYFEAGHWDKALEKFECAKYEPGIKICKVMQGKYKHFSVEMLAEMFLKIDKKFRDGEALLFFINYLIEGKQLQKVEEIMRIAINRYPNPEFFWKLWFFYLRYLLACHMHVKVYAILRHAQRETNMEPEVFFILVNASTYAMGVQSARQYVGVFESIFPAHTKMAAIMKKSLAEPLDAKIVMKQAMLWYEYEIYVKAKNILAESVDVLDDVEKLVKSKKIAARKPVRKMLAATYENAFFYGRCLEAEGNDDRARGLYQRLLAACMFVAEDAQYKNQYEKLLRQTWLQLAKCMHEKFTSDAASEYALMLRYPWGSKNDRKEILEAAESFLPQWMFTQIFSSFVQSDTIEIIKSGIETLKMMFPDFSSMVDDNFAKASQTYVALLQPHVECITDRKVFQSNYKRLTEVEGMIKRLTSKQGEEEKQDEQEEYKEEKMLTETPLTGISSDLQIPVVEKKFIEKNSREPKRSSIPPDMWPKNKNKKNEIDPDMPWCLPVKQAIQTVRDIPYGKYYVDGGCIPFLLRNETLPAYKDVDMAFFSHHSEQDELIAALLNKGYVKRECPVSDSFLYRKKIAEEAGMREVDCFVMPVIADAEIALLAEQTKLRGFTVSALFMSIRKGRWKIHDPDGRGCQDARDKILRMCHGVDAADYFRKDPVNILRAIKLMAEGYTATPDILKALSEVERNWQRDRVRTAGRLLDHFCRFRNNNKVPQEYKNSYDVLFSQYKLTNKLFVAPVSQASSPYSCWAKPVMPEQSSPDSERVLSARFS